jgi:hypothetical protein
MDQGRLKAYERHMALSRAHATVAEALKYPMLVNFGALQAARALIEASHVLDRQMGKPQEAAK